MIDEVIKPGEPITVYRHGDKMGAISAAVRICHRRAGSARRSS